MKTDDQILADLKEIGSNFALSLVSQYHKVWSSKQRFWAQKLSNERVVENDDVTSMCMYPKIVQMFAYAREAGLKRIKIKFRLSHGLNMSIGPSRKGGYYVYSERGGTYGIIDDNGALKLKLRNYLGGDRDELKNYLDQFEADPPGFASKMGKLMGACCFCSLTLSDERSLSVGYGPICAKHWKLPWG